MYIWSDKSRYRAEILRIQQDERCRKTSIVVQAESMGVKIQHGFVSGYSEF